MKKEQWGAKQVLLYWIYDCKNSIDDFEDEIKKIRKKKGKRPKQEHKNWEKR